MESDALISLRLLAPLPFSRQCCCHLLRCAAASSLLPAFASISSAACLAAAAAPASSSASAANSGFGLIAFIDCDRHRHLVLAQPMHICYLPGGWWLVAGAYLPGGWW
jgi:hypothetical protein